MHKLVQAKICLAGFILMLITFAATSIASQQDDSPLGLYVRDGIVMYQGEPYRAMGINYNNCFSLLLADANNRDFIEGFRILKEDYKIPYIRFMACTFDHPGWELYAKNPEEYFRRMDLIVKQAEKQQLGLIPSLFWYVVAVSDYVGEPLSMLGNENSKSRIFFRKYTVEMVKRYKDSPAIYGWEIGNEYMLFADLPKYDHLPPKKTGSEKPRTKVDKLLRPMLLDLYQDFHKTIRKIDKDRIIVTGDSIPRAQAWHNRNEDSWDQDTMQQWIELFQADTPNCYEVVSFHLYEQADIDYFKDKVSLEQVVSTITQICRNNKKVIWCGELGMPGKDEKARELFFRMMKTVENNNIELSAIWNFILTGRYQPDWDILPQGKRTYMLDAVKELNERFSLGVK